MRFDEIDFDELDEIEKNDKSNDILISFKPIIKVLSESLDRAKQDIDAGLDHDFMSEMLLIYERTNDAITLMKLLLKQNRSDTINMLDDNTFDVDKTKQLIDNLINKYNAKDLAEKFYESFKAHIRVNNDDNEAIDLSELDSLFED